MLLALNLPLFVGLVVNDLAMNTWSGFRGAEGAMALPLAYKILIESVKMLKTVIK